MWGIELTQSEAWREKHRVRLMFEETAINCAEVVGLIGHKVCDLFTFVINTTMKTGKYAVSHKKETLIFVTALFLIIGMVF